MVIRSAYLSVLLSDERKLCLHTVTVCRHRHESLNNLLALPGDCNGAPACDLSITALRSPGDNTVNMGSCFPYNAKCQNTFLVSLFI